MKFHSVEICNTIVESLFAMHSARCSCITKKNVCKPISPSKVSEEMT